jgi:tetratricopeptide (TPR) repeat protein
MMMMKTCVIRLWAPTILLGGMTLSASGVGLEAQVSQPATTSQSATPTPTSQDQKAQLQQAAKLAEAGKYAAAMVIYRRVLGTHPPAGDLALAYYDAESATEDGRPHAVAGLRALVEKYPADSQYQIALGRVLTYSPATREEGRKYLAGFPKDQQAAAALRQSLVWDAANPAVAPQIRAYLATHQDPQLAAVMQMTQGPSSAPAPSAQIPSRTASPDGPTSSTPAVEAAKVSAVAAQPIPIRPAVPVPSPSTPVASAPMVGVATAPAAAVEQTPSRVAPPAPNGTADVSVARTRAAAETAAYQALNANRIDEAETRFKAILAGEPGDSKALAGMGYVRMQQGNFLGAISFLERAKLNNSDDKGLAAALDTARFWFIMGEGQQSLNENDLTTAEKRYRAALALRPDSPEALEGLGGTLLKAQQPGPAIPIFEHAVEAQPASTGGWRDLLIAQLQAGNAPSALVTDKRIPAATHGQLMNDPLFLQALASAYVAVGRSGDAQTTLESALKLPFSADAKGLKIDMKVQLGGLLVTANHLDRAAELFQQVLAEDRGNTSAWQALVRVQHAMGHNQEALQTVESMPPETSAAAMRDPGFEVTVASIYQAEKKLDEAQALLQKVATQQTNAGQKPSPALEVQLAGVYIDRGTPQFAYPVYQQVIAENPDRADAWAGLLSALHLTGHDKEAVAQLKSAPASVRAQLENNPGYLQTMASVYEALGRSREATMFLGRVEQGYAAQRSAPPSDLEIQNAWLLYNGMDDAGLYRQLMSIGGRTDLTTEQRRTAQTIWTNWAVRRANQAAAVGDSRRALAILNAATRAFPDNSTAIKALALGYSQAGQPHQAVAIYKAQNMASASAADYGAAVGAALADGDSKDAEIWLRYALAAYPADPQILILGAKFEQARGDTARAIKYYRASLKAMPPAIPASRLAAELGIPGLSAPLTLPSADQPQALSVLLAPGAADSTSSGGVQAEPYLPSYGNQAPLPPYDGTSRVVPPYMTNPDGGKTNDSAEQAGAGPAPSPAIQPASPSGLASATNPPPQAAPQAPKASQPSGSGGEVYSPYFAYVAPPPPTPAITDKRVGNTAAVAVRLGNDAPHPEQPQTEVTDVLPTARYAPSARADRAAAAQPDVAAARAARIRRLQADSDAAARTGQSNPPPEDSITATTQNAQYTTQPQVAQPSTVPGGHLGNIPDTGTQQYPQPRTPPGPSSQTTIPRSRPVPRTPASAPVAIPPAAAREPAVPQPTPVAPALSVATNPAAVTPGVTQSYPTIGPAYPLAPPPTDAELRARNLPALLGYFEAQPPIPLTPRQQAESELASLEGSYSGWLGATGIGRYRGGTLGLDRLYDVEAPAEASAVIGKSVRLTAVALPVFLNSGVLNTSSFSTSYVPYLGTLPANTANPPAQQFSNGIGGELQLATKNIGLAVGYTPYEFLVRNVTGRFRLSTLDGHVSFYGEREPVKDTQLSYAGLRDPGVSSSGSGPIWGGVISTTGGVRIDLGSGASSFYISGEGGVLTGQHVLDNNRSQGAIGANFRAGNWPSYGSLTLGASLSGMHFAYNEVGLTYGQGGYFSPTYYFLASVPVNFSGHYKANFHYLITGALGVQTFGQDEAPFYPLDPALQSSFVPANSVPCTAAQIPSYHCGEYPVMVTTGFNYSTNAQASYRFVEHWYGGGFLSANNSNNYNTVSAGFFFRYVFRAQHSPEGYPAGLFQIEGIRPLQIP